MKNDFPVTWSECLNNNKKKKKKKKTDCISKLVDRKLNKNWPKLTSSNELQDRKDIFLLQGTASWKETHCLQTYWAILTGWAQRSFLTTSVWWWMRARAYVSLPWANPINLQQLTSKGGKKNNNNQNDPQVNISRCAPRFTPPHFINAVIGNCPMAEFLTLSETTS